MAGPPSIAVVDDGELQDVREVLEDLGVEFTHWTKALVPGQQREPSRLLVTTALHASSLRYKRPPRRQAEPPIWIAVIDTASKTQRTLLRQGGFDFLVRRPFHPTALRMLLQRSIYLGNENRRGKRVPVGYGVRYRSGLWPGRAMLVDLSGRGCRLLSKRALECGAKISVQLPSEIAGGRGLNLTGSVVRARGAEVEGGEPGETSIAVRFDEISKGTVDRLKQALVNLSEETAALTPKMAAEVEAAAEVKAAADSGQDALQARAPRGVYGERILVFGDADQVLVGCDLSRGGMRVEPHPGLDVGDRLRLAIEGGVDFEPVLVRAQVARDDGDGGLALHFEWVEPGAEARLDGLIAQLPAIESADAPDDSSEGRVVMSRMLRDLLRIPRTKA